MYKSNNKAFSDARSFDEDGIGILPSTKDLDNTLEEAYVSIPSNLFTLSRGLPITSYTMGDTTNLEGADKINAPTYDAISGRTTRTYVPSSRNEPITPYDSPIFIDTSNTQKITSYKQLKNIIKETIHTSQNTINIDKSTLPNDPVNPIDKYLLSLFGDTKSTSISHGTRGVPSNDVSQNNTDVATSTLDLSIPNHNKDQSTTNYMHLHNQRETFDKNIDEDENKILVEHIQNVIDSKMSKPSETNSTAKVSTNSKENNTSVADVVVDKLKYDFKIEIENMANRFHELMLQQNRKIDEQTKKNFEELFRKFLNS